MKDQWSSLHVFFHDFNIIEKVLHQLVWPSLQNSIRNNEIKKYFFIRYWEGGPHLRIRYVVQEGTDSQEFTNVLIDKWTDYLRENPSQIELEKEVFYQSHSLEGKSKKEIPNLPWFPNNSVQIIPYVPEWERYGGEKGIQIAEEYFCCSSEFVREILQNQHFNANRMAVVLDIMYLIFKVFSANDSETKEWKCFWGNYAKGWLEWENSEYERRVRAKSQMQAKKLGPKLLESLELMWDQFKLNGTYRGIENKNIFGMISAVDQLKKSAKFLDLTHTTPIKIMGSYMHMHNNRLGVYPAQEAYLSLLINELNQ
ncbi:hypothetical protein CN271_08075 [Bacillus cereus]|uniref:thiopeptide-type bacteriocin biosynthesis protein n=1 Tax=Bacillus cereus TaxID=1396 RepID=UPI000BED2BED|nr:thiopeptide-type bacteriocin biosynthesis protein [Bacillus cereus]PEE38308.1 hypothetical protein CON59_05455 [Bacillus cereus]PET51312.1 hypothetical protein CN523_03490 [Bacillus cereus]PEV82430.1 hypothetical protein CN429_14535 [Bacillus cereus]PFA56786.1 hypothetical protein CN389_11390 [Bacillus cereus]PFD76838.1 hypothetical protein CN271_08075 [Bacillus cereus]